MPRGGGPGRVASSMPVLPELLLGLWMHPLHLGESLGYPLWQTPGHWCAMPCRRILPCRPAPSTPCITTGACWEWWGSCTAHTSRTSTRPTCSLSSAASTALYCPPLASLLRLLHEEERVVLPPASPCMHSTAPSRERCLRLGPPGRCPLLLLLLLCVRRRAYILALHMHSRRCGCCWLLLLLLKGITQRYYS